MNDEFNFAVVGNWPTLENWGTTKVKLSLLHLLSAICPVDFFV